jgi:hypothetical protein
MASRLFPSLSTRSRRLLLDRLEARRMLAASPWPAAVAHPTYLLASGGGASPDGFTPVQVAHAYAFDQIKAGGVTQADGSGQTIAIVDAFDDPTIAGDLAAFDQQFGLPTPASFSKVDASGSVPATDSGWSLEAALDVEWAHAMAPGAGLVLVEADTSSVSDLMDAVDKARNLPGVTVVSMSWGSDEFADEASDDGFFATPDGHAGVTFVAASGDHGAPGLWPAMSPKVLSTGGTSLSLVSGDYGSETAWSKSGGGVSQYEPEPSYQSLVQSSGSRSSPDVAYNADPQTGFAVYNSGSGTGEWQLVGGTSAAAPQWAALLAIANQARAAVGERSLDGAQADLYKLPLTDFHDIVSGSNGEPVKVGYDLATGLGSPIANLIVSDLIGQEPIAEPTNVVTQSGGEQAATVDHAFGQPLVLTVLDQLGDPLPGAMVTFAAPDIGASASFPSGVTATTDKDGRVSEAVEANTVTGSYTVTASVAGITTPVSFDLTNEPGAAASLMAASGSSQHATIGAAFDQPLVVVVEDQFGNAVPGATVAFSAPAGGASATFAGGSPSVSDHLGRASVSISANNLAGSYTVLASVAGVAAPVALSLTNDAALTNLSVVATPSDNTSVFGQPIRVTAIVSTSPGLGLLGGSVTFLDGNTPLATVALAAVGEVDEATLTTTAPLSVGSHTITAQYSGDANDLPSAQTLTETVGQDDSDLQATSSAATLGLGRVITLTATVVANAPGTGTPGGVVDFVDTTTGDDLGSATLIAGMAQLPISTLAVGSHTIAANYRGDESFTSSSGDIMQDIVPLPESNVAPLAGVSQATFVVSWSGSDVGGPGIDGYDVLVSDNGGDYTTWLTATTQTSAAFAGQLGHDYRFESVAIDALGDRQSLPATAGVATAALAKDANAQYVATVYQQVLSRLPDDAGLDYWATRLDSGTALSSVAAAILHSDEYFANEVIGPAYLTYLGRSADDGGIAWWTAKLRGGMTDEQLQANLAASDEFYARAGGDNSAWIKSLYGSLLGRATDASAPSYWAGRLAGGETRLQVATSLATSQEHEQAQIDGDYLHYLHRTPDAEGLAYWLAEFGRGQTDEDLISAFVASPEFYQQATG